jgi:hypothetical protein
MANEKGLHVVELRKECSNFPKVIASPPKCKTASEVKSDDLLDYSQVF